MSISVNSLTKTYGSQQAISQISFDIPKGQIVGFLGPNGAGKSTTMKILTGYIDASSGTATVNGFSIDEQAMEVRKSIGYLPEHNPLYLDMYVRESLGFAGELYGIKGSTLKNRVAEMVEMVGLEREQHKKIGQLSKGYRQRVGLAQALIHDPAVLILDEPTTGLDPNQLIEIRQLIKNAGANKTVLLSTHIMQEVEQICQRAIIINRGQLVADSTVEELRAKGDTMEEVFHQLTK